MGTIAGFAAIAAFAAAGLMLILSALGFYHSRKVAPTAEILAAPRAAAGELVTA